ncbi:MAG TPA: NAD(P)-dependent oxidoreductase [Candidatus Latescibacteria bacterium]|nr:NAD(P)-dependent oxidoreductase [Candidatus Handelsmanbacteria bacterium]HIL09556.1 NAD(P)-dependent oxidoreductase [Candidatus Latescibacterota bacterium]
MITTVFFLAKISPPGGRSKLNVLVTGAAGYIGRIVARDLAQHHQVRGVDMRPMSALKDHRVIDLNDYDEIYDALEGMDAIAHLAWPMRPYEGYAPTDGTEMGAGVRGLFHLLQAALARGIERIVFQSTINITAPSWDNWRLIEAESPRPGSHGYTLGKMLAEELCQTFTRQHPITIAVIRFGGVFTLEEEGFENAAPDLHPIPSSCVERRDTAQAYHLALSKPLPGRYEVFHIFHERPGERFPINKARDILGFRPQYNEEQLWRRGGVSSRERKE